MENNPQKSHPCSLLDSRGCGSVPFRSSSLLLHKTCSAPPSSRWRWRAPPRMRASLPPRRAHVLVRRRAETRTPRRTPHSVGAGSGVIAQARGRHLHLLRLLSWCALWSCASINSCAITQRASPVRAGRARECCAAAQVRAAASRVAPLRLAEPAI